MNVLKFGGTSVGSPKNIEKITQIVAKISAKETSVIVVSALGGITNQLIQAGELAVDKNLSYLAIFSEVKIRHLETISALKITNEQLIQRVENHLNALEQLLKGIYLINELSKSTYHKLTSYGELLSSLIVAESFKNQALNVVFKNSSELIRTHPNAEKLAIDYPTTNEQITSYFKDVDSQIIIVPGYIASNGNDLVTLGRGGSDFSAAIIAGALSVTELQIWTDVSGMFTADPRLVPQAKPIDTISYQEAMELSHFGAKVLYPPTIIPVMNNSIPIRIKNTNRPKDHGTLISEEITTTKKSVTGLSYIDAIAILTIEGNGMVGVPGVSKRLFEALSNEQINIILITQASSEHSICIGVLEKDATVAKNAIEFVFENEIALHKIDPVIVENELSIIALVGDAMKNHQGICGKMFQTLGRNNINVRAIAQGASEKNISAVIASKDVVKALNSLHERFFEAQKKQLNVFIAGVGNVGGKLVEQIKQQQEYLNSALNLNVRICGLTTSRTMFFSENGIDLNTWQTSLSQGETANMNQFIERIKKYNLRNSIFVDVTASASVAGNYASFLKKSIAVVACNKIACSAKFEHYKELKELSVKYNAPFLFETNVGAGLPILDTLANLIASGDEIIEIKAVLSGSLNFVFNNFKSGDSFHDVVKLAQTEGYTEPDPRIDLSGVDVARKIVILARESGLPLALEDVENKPFLTPKNLESTSVENFYETLIADDVHFQTLVKEAEQKGNRLKYVAQLSNGKLSVGLEEISAEHPFYNLEGKDNIVLFYTRRYNEQPLLIKGAGAGGEVTASGLFSDIIRMRTY